MERNSNYACSAGYSSDSEMIRDIFEPYVEESISDEQIQRILAPVRKMILEGKFRRRRRFPRRFAIIAAVFVVILLVVIAPLIASPVLATGLKDIVDDPIPLAGMISEGNTLSGRVMMEGTGVEGIGIVLVDIERMEPVETAISAADGSYILKRIPNGAYRLTTTLPTGVSVMDGMEEDIWVLVDGTAEVVFNGEEMRKEADIWVYRT
jgi:hypothetical protein